MVSDRRSKPSRCAPGAATDQATRLVDEPLGALWPWRASIPSSRIPRVRDPGQEAMRRRRVVLAATGIAAALAVALSIRPRPAAPPLLPPSAAAAVPGAAADAARVGAGSA